jgi:hypothetical protein
MTMNKIAASLMAAACLIVTGVTACSPPEPKTKKLGISAGQPSRVFEETKVYRLEDLNHRTADHSTPDAIVYIAPYFNPSSPIHLIVYNHGMMTNLEDVESTWKISESARNAPPNTVIIAPEWAVSPKELSSNAGAFHKPGFFKDMLTEIFSKVPELALKSIDRDVDEITLASFSGGLYVLRSELHKNGLEDKVKAIALFDSLYKTGVLDGWLKKNLNQLATGQKQFYNFYFHTYPRSVKQAQLLQRLFKEKGYQVSECMRWDTDAPNSVMSAERIAKRPVVFKYAINGDENLSGHNAVPTYYIPEFMKSLSIRKQGTMLATGRSSPAM